MLKNEIISGKNEVYLPIRAKAWVQVVIETTKLGTEEQERLTLLPSAKRTSLFPFGQIIWSTCVRTFSQVKSWVLSDITSISVLEWPMLHTEKLLDKHNQTFIQRKTIRQNKSIKQPIFFFTLPMHPFFILSICSRVITDLFPDAVITISTFFTTLSILTTWYPSMQACNAQIGSKKIKFWLEIHVAI